MQTLSSSFRQQALLLLAATLIFFVNLGKAQLWDDDEPKNAQCAREMFLRGDWLVPTFNGELRCDKPVLVYWLMMSAYQAFGGGEFAARFWSAVAAVGTTLLTYHIGRTLFKERIGFWSGWIMASTLMFVIAGRAATPDSVMIFCTTLAMFVFVRATWGASGTLAGANQLADYLPHTWAGVATVYTAMALGVLTKGPVALVLPTLVLVSYVALVRQTLNAPTSAAWWRHCLHQASPVAWIVAGWRLRPFTALLTLAVIAAPWYLLVSWHTDGEWLIRFFGRHNIGRYLSPMENHHGPFWYYVPAVLFGFFPWSIVLPQAVVRAATQLRHSTSWAAWLFLTCWAGVWIGFFSCSGTKLPSYITPAFPALAVMTAAWIDGWLTEPTKVNRWFLYQSMVSLGVVGVAFIVAIPIVARYVLPGEALLGIVGVPLVAGSIASLVWAVRRPHRAVAALAVSALGFMVLMFAFAAVRASRHQNSNALVAALNASDSPLAPAAFDLTVPSTVYYTGCQIPQFTEADVAVRYLRSSPRSLLVTYARGYEKLRSQLPGDITIVARQQRFLRRSDVIVLGHRSVMAKRPTPGKRRK